MAAAIVRELASIACALLTFLVKAMRRLLDHFAEMRVLVLIISTL